MPSSFIYRAEIIIPILIPILLPIIFPGGLPTHPVPLPMVSVSQSTSVATTVHKKPVSFSHSSSVATGSSAACGGAVVPVSPANNILNTSFNEPNIRKLFKSFNKSL